ncbi:MAG: tripartite tricarboxylate transporter TctB family protein, partial [Lachnospiraceae bacterium]|nr:tripartite tricarboxylate transporter TctB family protein [Lachnospiraceae bacterium]
LPIIAVGAIALALAFWCYRKKPAEVCGKAMAFPKTKAVIKIFVTVEAGLAGGVILYGFSGQNTLFLVIGLIAGTLLCHGVTEVIYDFDIRSVKNGWKSLLVSAGVVAALFSVFQFDLTGYDSYVPEPEQVDHIAFLFTDEYYNGYYDEKLNSVGRDDYIFEHMQLTDIAPVLELAKKRMGEEPEEGTQYRYCVVRYQMKNGSFVYRQFPTAYREDVALLDEIVTDPAYQKGGNAIYNEPFVALDGNLSLYYDGGSGRKELTSASMQELVLAYRRDLEDFSFTDMMNQRVRGKLQMECIEQGMYIYQQFPVYPGFENTIALLEKEGLYTEEYVDLDEVEQMIVTNSNSALYDAYTEDGEYGETAVSADFQTEASFTDKGEMEQIKEALYPNSFAEFWTPGDMLDADYSVTVVYKNGIETEDTGNRYTNGYYMLAGEIPDFVKEKTTYKGEN